MPDTIHPEDKFGQLDWTKLDPDQCTRSWSFGYGGYGLTDDKMTISIVRENGLDADIWVVPDALRAIVRVAEACGRRHVRDAVKAALDIR